MKRICWSVFALLSLACIAKHLTFHYGVYDLGIFHQVLWNTAHGRWFQSSLKQMSYLGDHFSPGLALLAPLEWLPFPVEALLLAQAAAVAVAAWCVYALALARLRDARLATLFGTATALLLFAPAAWDFHPELFMAAALAAALLALERDQWGRAALWLALVLSGKEDSGLVTLGLGLLLTLDRRTRGFGVVLALLSLVWMALVIALLMPRFRPPVHGEWFYLQRYAHLGASPGAIARFVLLHPLSSLARSLTGWKLLTAAILLGGFALAPLRSLRLLALLPAVAEHLLSSRAAQFDFQFHYLAPLVPLVAWAAIAGAPSTVARWPRLATLMVLLVGLGAGVIPRLWPGYFWPRPQHAGLRQAVRAVPPDAPLCAQMRFGAWLSARREFSLCVRWETERAQYDYYGWPQFSTARYQIFDLQDDDGAPGLVARARALEATGAEVLSERDGVVLLKLSPRAADSSSTTPSR